MERDLSQAGLDKLRQESIDRLIRKKEELKTRNLNGIGIDDLLFTRDDLKKAFEVRQEGDWLINPSTKRENFLHDMYWGTSIKLYDLTNDEDNGNLTVVGRSFPFFAVSHLVHAVVMDELVKPYGFHMLGPQDLNNEAVFEHLDNSFGSSVGAFVNALVVTNNIPTIETEDNIKESRKLLLERMDSSKGPALVTGLTLKPYGEGHAVFAPRADFKVTYDDRLSDPSLNFKRFTSFDNFGLPIDFRSDGRYIWSNETKGNISRYNLHYNKGHLIDEDPSKFPPARLIITGDNNLFLDYCGNQQIIIEDATGKCAIF